MDVTSEKCRYGKHHRQTLTVHRAEPAPCEPGPRPVVIAIHGGYWAQQSSMQGWPRRLAAEAGYVVLEMEYRLNGDAAWPAQRDDVHAVMDWAAEHAERWGIDPDRLALAGSSAGGHLAAAAAVAPAPGTVEGVLDTATARQRPAVRTVVALSPPLSPYRAWRDGERPTGAPWRRRRRYLRTAAAKLAGCAPSKSDPECWDTWRDMVVKNHAAAGNPPMWLAYFTDDLVPAEHGHDYRNAQAAAGAGLGSVFTLVVQGTGHAMTLLDDPAVAVAIHGHLSVHLSEGPHLPSSRAPLTTPATSTATGESLSL